MKKFLSLILSAVIAITCFVPSTAFATDIIEGDIFYTEQEIESLEHIDATYVETLATGLITKKKLTIAKDGTKLVIYGYTYGSSEVVKCGFTTLVIQRKKASATSWSDYKTYDSLYSSSNTYTYNSSITVPSGYQYRVAAMHYAKKSLLSTQKIAAVTGYIAF